jgi:DNA-binding NarL/FixJ family response regulator
VAITVVIADDHPIVLMGLDNLFALEREYRVVARCVSGEEALDAVAKHDPDILIVDMKMQPLDGIAVLEALKRSEARVRTILLSASIHPTDVRTALRLGARGVIFKEQAPQQLIQCVRTVHEGGYWLEQAGLSDVLREEPATPHPSNASPTLTGREREIVNLVADGLRNKEIAKRLDIAEGTVKVHLNNMAKKLGVENRVGLLLHAGGGDFQPGRRRRSHVTPPAGRRKHP